MTKVKAFTVLEVLITMGVMAIIVSLTYLLYGSFSQQIMNYQKNSIEAQNFEQFTNQLQVDLFEAEKVIKSNNTIEFSFYSDKKSILYEIGTNELSRTQGNLKEILMIKNVEIETLNSNSDLITKLNIISSLFNEELQVELIKIYPPNLSIQY